MNTPLGHNPVAQPAPGLPRHDAPLPGHAPGQSTAAEMGGAASATPFGLPIGGYFPGAIWFGRGFLLVLSYLGLPALIPLYPMAAAPALAAGWVAYTVLHRAGTRYDDSMSWSWTTALVVLLPLMRVEIDYADRSPSYRALRHWFRLLLFASGTFYLETVDQHAPAFVAVLASALVAVALHFVLRFPLAKLVLHACQQSLWLRKKA
jgi:hypothetical protein